MLDFQGYWVVIVLEFLVFLVRARELRGPPRTADYTCTSSFRFFVAVFNEMRE